MNCFRIPCTWLVGFLCIFTMLIGCEDQPKKTSVRSTAKSKPTAESRASNVADAINYLSLLMRLDRSMAVKEVTYQLNSWAQVYDKNDGWQRSPMLDSYQGTSGESPILIDCQTSSSMRANASTCCSAK